MTSPAADKHDWATIPNAITVLRFLLVVPICYYLLTDSAPVATAFLLLRRLGLATGSMGSSHESLTRFPTSVSCLTRLPTGSGSSRLPCV